MKPIKKILILSIIKSRILPLLYLYRFIRGAIYFKFHKTTPQDSYEAMRSLYVFSNGRFNDFISYLINIFHPKYKEIIASGILGDLNLDEISNIANEIKKNGYYISSKKLTQDIIVKIVNFAENTPSVLLTSESLNNQSLSNKKVTFNPDHPLSPIYRFSMQQVFENPDLLSLLLDQSLLAVAQEYLNCSPVLDLVLLWWSIAFEGKGKSEAAQEFHFDMDRIKFLKIFIYLNDVDTNNGPHCYVVNSHKRKPKSLLSDGRKTDSEIEAFYPKSDIRELCAPSGSIILADTRGFHKGKPLIQGQRLLFQIEYSNSLFGQNYPKVNFDLEKKILNPEFKRIINLYPRTYKQLLWN